MRRNFTDRLTQCGRILPTGALAVLLIGSAVPAVAEPPALARYAIDQPSQALADSLRSIARQTGISVLFDPAAVNGRSSRPVSGRLSAIEAISQALEGTGLTADIMSDGAIVVRSMAASGAGQRVPTAAQLPVAAVNPSPDSDLRVAQLASQEGPGTGAAAPNDRGPSQELQKVEVTGSRLKRITAEGPVPVNVYTREEIDRSGQPTLERFLATLNEVSVTQGEGTFGPMSGQGSVQLRGLPLGSTLVLINGRRVQAVGSSSANFFNLNLIPMAAVERVEVVPVGSSAVYGGDALAGVVNIILKKSIDGVSMDARVGSGKGLGDGSFSLATGGRDESGSFLVLGTYSKSTPLTMAERAFFVDADYRRFGGPDARTRSCTPGTVSSTTGDNLPGLNSTFAGVPSLAPGQALTQGSFAATAGQANLCNTLASGRGYALVYGDESFGLHASAERRLLGSWSVFGELTHVKDRLKAEQGGLLLSNVVVQASNPYNPFGVPVRFTGRLGLENGSEGLVRDTNFTRALIGLRGDLGSAWDFEASVSTSRDEGKRLQLNNAVNSAARTAALASTDPAAALNPFTAGPATSPEVLRSIWSDAVRNTHGVKDLASAFVRGSPYELPAGPIEAIAGLEYARDRYESLAPNANSVNSRNSSAVFGEFRVPLARGGVQGEQRWDLAALTLAGRRDRYSDFGSASTYQAGLEVRPARSVLLRAAVASSFKPPTLLQTSVDEISYTTEIFELVDPANGGAPIVGGEVLRTSNPDLKPEKGKAWSLGALWEPEGGLGSRLGVTAWKVKIDGLIALLWPQDTIDNESLFPGIVTRGPSVNGAPGPVTRVLYTEVNVGSLETAGADVEGAYAWRATGGRWTVAASATRTTQYDVRLAPGSPVEDRLGRRAADYWSPKLKGRLSLGFDAGTWSLGLTSRYLGSYKDSGTSERRLGDYWMHDLSGQLDLKRLGMGFAGAKAATLSLAIANLADRLPEFVETSPYYDITQADWRGRYATLRLSVDW
jgi:iron complex outermembrane receptor protein